MSSVAVIGDIDTVSGFRLGGVKEAVVVKTADEVHMRLILINF